VIVADAIHRYIDSLFHELPHFFEVLWGERNISDRSFYVSLKRKSMAMSGQTTATLNPQITQITQIQKHHIEIFAVCAK